MKDRGAVTMACALSAWLCAVVCLCPSGAGAEEAAPPAAAGGGDGAQGDDPLIGDKPLSDLLAQLKHQNKGIQLRAAKALIEAPAELRPKMMPKMMALLKSERENDKYVAAFILGECGPAAKAAIPDLLPMLEGTQYERNRAAAAKALGLILKDAKPSEEIEKVTQALIRKIDPSGEYDKYTDVRREAVTALGMIGPAAKQCIPKLVPAMTQFQGGIGYSQDQEYRLVRKAAAWTCGRMGPLAVEHVDLLISRMHTEGTAVPETVEALGLIGPVKENIIPNIMDAIERAGRPGDAGWFKTKAFEALGRFGGKSSAAVPVMKRMLQNTVGDQSMTVKIAIVKCLGRIGPSAKDAAPELLSHAQWAQSGNQEEIKVLREEAAKAYKAVTGQDPASGDKEKKQ